MNLKRPKPSEPFLDARGLVTRPWFNYLSALTPSEASAEIELQLQALGRRVSELEGEGGGLPQSTRAYGQLSVQSNGTLSDGMVVFNLVNDEAAPAPRSYYGTDDAGTLGYQPLPSGGFLPMTTGEIVDGQPVFLYGPDGRLIYGPVS